MNNEIKLTINISDQLLGKLMLALQQPQNNNMAIPLQALMGLPIQPPPKPQPKQKAKAPIGFKA